MIKILLTLISLTFIQHCIAQNAILKTKKIEINRNLKTKYLARILPLNDFCLFEDLEEDTIKSFMKIHGENFSFFRASKQDTVIVFDGNVAVTNQELCRYTN